MFYLEKGYESLLKLEKLTLGNGLSLPASINREFLNDVIAGLSVQSKSLPCKYFYDERGSQLFDEICLLDEYYLTRTEMAIMDRFIDEMSYQLGSRIVLVEFGSGSSTKTLQLLDALHNPVGYVPVDISKEHLLKTAADLRVRYPFMQIMPVVADFTESFEIPHPGCNYSHAALFFPGSTIGNFLPEEAVEMMTRMARVLGPNGGLLMGIDLKKDAAVLEAAYDDSQGVTAEFNLNLLHRINRELGGDFDVSQFAHSVTYNESMGRIETYIVSKVDQAVHVEGHEFQFAAGEKIHTEYSHKFNVDEFCELASQAGFSLHKHWTDDADRFAIVHLVNEAESAESADH